MHANAIASHAAATRAHRAPPGSVREPAPA